MPNLTLTNEQVIENYLKYIDSYVENPYTAQKGYLTKKGINHFEDFSQELYRDNIEKLHWKSCF